MSSSGINVYERFRVLDAAYAQTLKKGLTDKERSRRTESFSRAVQERYPNSAFYRVGGDNGSKFTLFALLRK